MTFEKTDISPREKGAEMSSVLRSVRKRKKGRTLGPVEIIGCLQEPWWVGARNILNQMTDLGRPESYSSGR